MVVSMFDKDQAYLVKRYIMYSKTQLLKDGVDPLDVPAKLKEVGITVNGFAYILPDNWRTFAELLR